MEIAYFAYSSVDNLNFVYLDLSSQSAKYE